MRRYPVSKARERMSAMLDEVDRSGSAVIERGDVQYVIRVKRPAPQRRPRVPIIEIVDPHVEAGEWRWDWTPKGLRFKGGHRRGR